MRLGKIRITVGEPVKPAAAPELELEERVTRVEAAVNHLADDFEAVLDRINRWSARQAAQKRHQAIKNLEEATEPPEDANVDPGAGEEETREQQLANKRAQLKAQLRAKYFGRREA